MGVLEQVGIEEPVPNAAAAEQEIGGLDSRDKPAVTPAHDAAKLAETAFIMGIGGKKNIQEFRFDIRDQGQH
jgi:hypothetical protein